MVIHHLSKFSSHRYCGSEDTINFVVSEQVSIYSHLKLSSLFIPKAHSLKHTVYHVNKYDIGHTRRNINKNAQTTFSSPSKSHWREGEGINKQFQSFFALNSNAKRKIVVIAKRFCVTCKSYETSLTCHEQDVIKLLHCEH